MDGGGQEGFRDEEIIHWVKADISESGDGDHAGGQFQAQQPCGNQRSQEKRRSGDHRGGCVQIAGAHHCQKAAGQQTQQGKFEESVRRR